jgi:flagellar hook-associated protein 3 FlgL
VFSGFRTNTPALSADGKFLGDDGAIFVSTGEGKFSQINLQSRHLFEPTESEKGEGKAGLIDSLNMLYHGLHENDKGLIQKSMHHLDNQLEKASSFQATIGAMTNSFDGNIKRVELDKELTMKTVSEIEDTDMFETSSNFKRSETVLQSTLLASNKILQPSLLNFLQ